MTVGTITLTPRGWVPDTRFTGGCSPPQSLTIQYAEWERCGKPQSIEEYWEEYNKRATKCPCCGKAR